MGLVVTVAALIALYVSGMSSWWRLLVFFPAAASASGFLQAHFRFCFGFSRAGVFNFSEVGRALEVTDEEDLAEDRRRGNQIALYSALIGAAVALVTALVG